jgi:hypothetical protein
LGFQAVDFRIPFSILFLKNVLVKALHSLVSILCVRSDLACGAHVPVSVVFVCEASATETAPKLARLQGFEFSALGGG